ncbi:MAG: peptidoglycan DD-metalloendopeptidase family protein [Clostridia bacterium]|nr:peptidoglycan DD-metalloendopeptidase family protein [Clostridia bacterium]MDD3092810.1 peptidoglycan DD-metalloendopeptidase family protein [Clostridia bacterium]MDD3970546.1 peptidoglycan DD-metalloendopeptidase family protein [Clostridia bacterium]HXK71690.1 peptidoglycan DD-metalloendopeptidase family protein [Clostridia bacterium]
MKKRICFRTKITHYIILILVLSFLTITAASDYDRAYVQKEISNLSLQALSPYKNTQGIEYWPLCTSKNNQPRFVTGTNPHQGTDLTINVGEHIYPIYDGEIIYIKKDISSQTGHIVVKSEIGYTEPVYIEYLHVIPIDGIDEGDFVYTCIPIATIDEYKRYDSHLHIGRVNEDRTLHYQIYDLYKDVLNWKNGSDLDVFSYPDFNTETNIFTITAYVSSDTENTDYYAGYGRFPLEYITFFYSVNNGTWKSKNIHEYSDNFKYSFNVKQITGSKSNDTIRYYITATRDNNSSLDTTFKDASYKTAYYPAYYAHPGPALTNQLADAIALTITIH